MRGSSGLEILYEDDCIIVIDKPSGLLTMSTGKDGENTAYSILTDYVRRGRKTGGRRAKTREQRIFIVHRLDRDTSGTVLFAKDPDTKYALQDSWNETVLERNYVAVLEGRPSVKEGEVASWLKDNPKSFKVSSSPVENGGKYAVTRYRVLGGRGKYSLVEFTLLTGRKNQIRVHAADIGHPVAGDRKYGASTNPLHRLCLHARTLSFRHPSTGEVLSFDTGIPPQFLSLAKPEKGL